MKEEAENSPAIPLTNFRERALTATGISLPTYNRICNMSKEVESGASASFSTPRKKRRISRKIDTVEPGAINALRDLIHDFYIIEKQRPTLKGAKSGDYHDDMNHANFSKWVETQLNPNLPERSGLVVDNVSYHNVKAEKSPTSGTQKDEMINWLTQHNVDHNSKVTKPELYKLIKDHKEQETTYRLDTLFEQHGRKVLRLSPYHPELNPIEKNMGNEGLAREEFSKITVDDWSNLCNHVNKYENEVIEKEHILDNFIDSLVFSVNTGSSDEDDFGSVFSDSNDSDDGLAGIEPLN
ncbi:hypothetical protein NQ314_000060 [Rhamnusium bicolor]|uniref:Tc1-like transposase DDE domain-containing protein n=1 Tax=Rhamnusium bicolor TaxID=1586634 RepID=A0AAV8ZZC1_9CUCU|nr:hypothetical protein NQ314_000060 [Rhamnusium bicolor]